MPLTVTPSRAHVAALIPDHTYDSRGNRLADFRESGSAPTQADADTAITLAETIVTGKAGRIPTDAAGTAWEAVAGLAQTTIAHRAAMTLVTALPSAEPEYERLRRIYEGPDGRSGLLADTIAAMQQAAAGEDPSEIDDKPAASPYGSFGAAMTSTTEAY